MRQVRLAFVLGKVAFKDNRIKFPEWSELKKRTKYGQLPMMKIGELEIAQSDAMLRYAGGLSGLIPTDEQTLLKMNEAIGLEGDIYRAIMPSMYIGFDHYRPKLGHGDKSEAEWKKVQADLRADLISNDGDLFKLMQHVEDRLKENKYMAGDVLTIADCQMIPRIAHLKSGIMDGIPKTFLDVFPKINAYYNAFREIPAVKAYYDDLDAKKAAKTLVKAELQRRGVTILTEGQILGTVIGETTLNHESTPLIQPPLPPRRETPHRPALLRDRLQGVLL